MKHIIVFFLTFIPFILSAQDYILRAGDVVYKYDESENKWSEAPLPLYTVLHYGDSIKTKTAFTLEVPRSFKNLLSKRFFTYVDYPNGVRLDSHLVEKPDRYTQVNTDVVGQGAKDSLINHLSWIQHHADNNSELNISFSIYDSRTWQEFEDNGTVSVSSTATISVMNREPFGVYVYLLINDGKWSYYKFKNCDKDIWLNSFSYFEERVYFEGPLVEQKLLFLCSKEQISQEVFFSVLNNNNLKSEFYDEYNKKIGFAYKQLLLTR